MSDIGKFWILVQLYWKGDVRHATPEEIDNYSLSISQRTNKFSDSESISRSRVHQIKYPCVVRA